MPTPGDRRRLRDLRERLRVARGELHRLGRYTLQVGRRQELHARIARLEAQVDKLAPYSPRRGKPNALYEAREVGPKVDKAERLETLREAVRRRKRRRFYDDS